MESIIALFLTVIPADLAVFWLFVEDDAKMQHIICYVYDTVRNC